MFIKKEIQSLTPLFDLCWSGALDTLNQVQEEGKEQELLFLLEDVFLEEIPDIGVINDFLWFNVPEILNLYED